MNKNIGVRKNRAGINIALGFLTFIFSMLCLMQWTAGYGGNFYNEYWIKNGIEVEAECYEYISVLEESHRVVYYCKYRYINENGKEYKAAVRFYNKNAAQAEIGNKITIVIDPNSSDVRHVNLKSLKLTYERDLILAIIFSLPVPIVLYLFVYRGVYRSVLDYKIRKRIGERNSDFINGSDYKKDLITQGEVTKTRKWIVGYVKVKYRDGNGVEREKWAHAWFTRKEAKFLEQKKFINVVPYKNTYGVLEEMPLEK